MTDKETAIMKPEESGVMAKLSIAEVARQVASVQELMSTVLKENTHYGVIPGCGNKPSLLKPGAEKLAFTFRLRTIVNPETDIRIVDLGEGHRELTVITHITNSAGVELATGLGSCSTMEGKYRFRSADKVVTDNPVPKKYWDLRNEDPKEAQKLLGGPGYGTKKVDGKWVITKGSGEKVEHDNPADYYNTVLKMAKKRSQVDGILSATAASDVFTQDIEDMKEVIASHPDNKTVEPTQAASPAPVKDAEAEAAKKKAEATAKKKAAADAKRLEKAKKIAAAKKALEDAENDEDDETTGPTIDGEATEVVEPELPETPDETMIDDSDNKIRISEEDIERIVGAFEKIDITREEVNIMVDGWWTEGSQKWLRDVWHRGNGDTPKKEILALRFGEE